MLCPIAQNWIIIRPLSCLATGSDSTPSRLAGDLAATLHRARIRLRTRAQNVPRASPPAVDGCPKHRVMASSNGRIGYKRLGYKLQRCRGSLQTGVEERRCMLKGKSDLQVVLKPMIEIREE